MFVAAAAFEADDVQAAQFAAVAGYHRERDDVAPDAGHAAYHRLAPDTAELVNRRVAAEDDAVAQTDVAADDRIVGHDDIVADDAVVRNVRVNHKHAVAADAGGQFFRFFTRNRGLAFWGAGVHGYVFADDVVRTDYQPRAGLEFVAVILRAAAEAGAGENDIAFAEGGVAQDGYAGDELVSGSDFGLA